MKVTLKNVRLSFPDIFEAKQFKGQGKARYSATFLIEPGTANDVAVTSAINAAAKEAWGEKAKANLAKYAGDKMKMCYHDGDKTDYDGYKGMKYLSCHNQSRPTVLDRDKSPLTADDGKPYAGCYVNAIVDVYIQGGEYPGVRASFSGVQFVADGDAFGGGRAAAPDDFEDLTAGSDAESMV